MSNVYMHEVSFLYLKIYHVETLFPQTDNHGETSMLLILCLQEGGGGGSVK